MKSIDIYDEKKPKLSWDMLWTDALKHSLVAMVIADDIYVHPELALSLFYGS